MLSHPKTILLHNFLVRSAMLQQLVTYEQAGAACNLPCFSAAFSDRLTAIADYSLKKYSVVLPAIVIKKYEGIPGGGFFSWTDKNIGPQDNKTDLWVKLVRATHEYYTSIIEKSLS